MERTLQVSSEIENVEPLNGSCFIVGAPIEERDDMTQRGIRTLQSADLVVTSNERYTASLLKRFALSKKLLGISEEIADDVIEMVMAKLVEGKRIVILSDPSFRFSPSLSLLIDTIRQAGLEPRVIPGVDLIATALAMSGFDSQCYAVVGAIPTRREARVAFVESLVGRSETLVVPGGMARIIPSLATLSDLLPEREAVLILRPTVPGEKIMRGSIASIYAGFNGKKFQGEFVIILAPLATDEEFDEAETGFFVPEQTDHESGEGERLAPEGTAQESEEVEALTSEGTTQESETLLLDHEIIDREDKETEVDTLASEEIAREGEEANVDAPTSEIINQGNEEAEAVLLSPEITDEKIEETENELYQERKTEI